MNTTAKNPSHENWPHSAMILAAGEGRRMRPLTDLTPKPLLRLGEQAIIDHVLADLVDFGITRVVVNLHHLGTALRTHLGQRRDIEIIFSDESAELMNSGGGIAKALPLLGAAPFFVMNGDAPKFDQGPNTLAALANAFSPDTADALLLLHRTDRVPGYDGPGDYQMDPAGALSRRPGAEPADYVFTGTQLLSPALFHQAPAGAFSSLELFDRAERAGRLRGLEHRGLWLHINTPDGLARANAELRQWRQ